MLLLQAATTFALFLLQLGTEPKTTSVHGGYASLDDCTRATEQISRTLGRQVEITNWGTVDTGGGAIGSTTPSENAFVFCGPELLAAPIPAPPPAELSCDQMCDALFTKGGLFPAEVLSCHENCAAAAPK